MSVVAAAVIGSTIVGAVVSSRSAKAGAKASAAGADSAAQAQIVSTELQVEEIQRQFDYQQQLLKPLVQQQYNAGAAFASLLGVSGPGAEQNAARSAAADEEIAILEQSKQQKQAELQDVISRGSHRNPQEYQRVVNRIQGEINDYDAQIEGVTSKLSDPQYIDPQYSGQATDTGVNRAADGSFADRNLNQTRLQDTSTLGDQVRGNLQAGTGPDGDPYRNYIENNQIAAGSVNDDLRFSRARDVTNAGATLAGDDIRGDVNSRRLADGAAGQGVYGEEFNTSPGYTFAKEEMGRELDRKNSAGGNYGGRAIMEAQRRASGLANQEYYNWAQGRTQDLTRQAQAEAGDAARLDYAGQQYADRRGTDIARGDSAVDQYERQRVMDQGRGDDAYQNYLGRKQGDAARLDYAAGNDDRLQQYDMQRQDQAYYNYLSNVGQMAGFGNATGQAVQSSQASGQGISNAYGNQGNNLSQIYAQEGNNQANIALNAGANLNNAIQSGIGNWVTFNAGQAAAPTPPVQSAPVRAPIWV